MGEMNYHLIVVLALTILVVACTSQIPPLPNGSPPAVNETGGNVTNGSITPPPGLGSDGFLAGNVTIGPRCPVEPCQTPPNPVVYTSREVIVSKGSAVVGRTHLNADGTYLLELPVGAYTATVQPAGMPGVNQTKMVTIEPGVTTRLDFDIDTGIR